jgi:hypothetical protein
MRSILQARREGPAFFDEDDVCAGLGASMQPVLLYGRLKKFFKRD